MMKQKTILFYLIFIALLHNGNAETPQSPFVSSLEVFSQDNRIIITWNDAPFDTPGYHIYRARSEIDSKNIHSAIHIGSVSKGQEYFIDYPPDTGEHYYAVLGLDDNKQPIKLFLPYRNTTMKPISVTTVVSVTERAASISNISASKRDDSVYISFTNTELQRKLSVFRHTDPMSEPTDITSASIITEGLFPEGKVVDRDLIPGVTYYYAVIDTELVLYNYNEISIDPGNNSTTTGLTVPIRASDISTQQFTSLRSNRATPLPFFMLDKSILTGIDLTLPLSLDLPSYRQLSEGSQKSIAKLSPLLATIKPSPLEPTLLPIDRAAEESSEAFRLKRIIEQTLLQGKHDEGERLLANFMSIRHEREIEIRSHFYLGQIYYFQNKYTKAFFEFIMAQEKYYLETAPWLDAIYQELIH